MTEPDATDATGAPSGSGAKRPDTAGRAFMRLLRDVAVVIIIALVVAAGVKNFLVRSFYIPSRSMVSTLEVNDRVLVNQLVPRFGDVKRGDVVVFRDPGGWLGDAPAYEPTPLQWAMDAVGLGSSDSSQFLIKRVIGVPGDHIVCCDADNRLTINGEPIEETYLREVNLPASNTVFDVTVPEGKLWVMGDNRNESADSRAHTAGPDGGFVDIDGDVIGRAFVIFWPVERWSGLGDFPEVFGNVPDAK